LTQSSLKALKYFTISTNDVGNHKQHTVKQMVSPEVTTGL